MSAQPRTSSERTAEYVAICHQYEALGEQAIYGKGGVWLRGRGFRPLRIARQEIAAGKILVPGDTRKGLR